MLASDLGWWRQGIVGERRASHVAHRDSFESIDVKMVQRLITGQTQDLTL